MTEIHITKYEARKFILYKQGLLGDYQFEGKSGILDFVRKAECFKHMARTRNQIYQNHGEVCEFRNTTL